MYVPPQILARLQARPLEPGRYLYVVFGEVPEPANTHAQQRSIWARRDRSLQPALSAIAVWSVPEDEQTHLLEDGRPRGDFWGWIEAQA